MCTGDGDLRPLGAPLHGDDVHANTLAKAIMLARDLLAARQDRLRLAQADDDVIGARVYVADGAVDEFPFTLRELSIHGIALRLTDALSDHLLGSLGRNAAEIARLDLHVDKVADFGPRLQETRLLQRHLVVLILDVIRDELFDKDLGLAGVRVQLDADVLTGAIVPLVGGNQRHLDRLEDHSWLEIAI